jgi:RIO kinase 1
LVKLLNKKLFTSINGCVSTGKEANVYHAENAEIKEEFAVKIFKTSILIFKDRNKYVEGEFRFRKGHKQSNPRQMIKQWAEKEVRNLKRIEQSSINCPIPVLVKSNVLVMKFIGKHGFAAPRLRDALITDVDEFSKVYLKIIYDMRVLY